MKQLLVGFIAFFFTFTAYSYPGLEEVHDFGYNPGNLAFFKYEVALNQNESLPRPLVIALHGCNQSAGAIARTSDWNKLADKYGFYVIYPEQKMINNPSRCFNWFREKDFKGHGGEVGSIHMIVKYMKSNYLIDSSRIYIYGLSAGAAMGVAYMANYPDEIECGAIFAGSAYGMADNGVQGLKKMRKPEILSEEEWVDRFKTARPNYKGNYPRLIAFHGITDKIVNLGNSIQLVRQFVGLNNATDKSVEEKFTGIPEMIRKSYKDSSGTERVALYLIENFGHKLAVDPGEDSLQGGSTGAFARDIGFFSTYYVAKDFGLLKSR